MAVTEATVLAMLEKLTENMDTLRKVVEEGQKERASTGNEEKAKEKQKEGRRTLGKEFTKEAKSFDGKEEDYFGWAFHFRMCVKTENEDLLKVLDGIEGQPNEVDMQKLEEEYKKFGENTVRQWSTELYEVLGKKLEDTAMTTLRNVEDMNGFEVWRLLYRSNNSTSPSTALESLVGVLVSPKIAHEKDLNKALDEWSIKE
jgi:hypothetical protein